MRDRVVWGQQDALEGWWAELIGVLEEGATWLSPSCGLRGRCQCSNRRARLRSGRCALRTTERTPASFPSCGIFLPPLTVIVWRLRRLGQNYGLLQAVANINQQT